MKPFADTNWLVAAYFAGERLSLVERFSRKHPSPLHITPAVMAESRCAFAWLCRERAGAEFRKLSHDVGGKIVLHPGWPERKAAELADKYCHKARLGTLDVMILAGALDGGATHFLCFDTGSNLRAAAALEKLEVFPELTDSDKSRMAQLR